jgi:hypothetical protein
MAARGHGPAAAQWSPELGVNDSFVLRSVIEHDDSLDAEDVIAT